MYLRMYVHMYVRMYVCMHVCRPIYVCMYVCMYVCVCVCIKYNEDNHYREHIVPYNKEKDEKLVREIQLVSPYGSSVSLKEKTSF